MTVDELYKNKTFLNACGLVPDAVKYISQHTYFNTNVLNCSNKFFTCLIHDITLTNSYKIVDYTHIPQSEIDKVISAKIKYDLSNKSILSRVGAFNDFDDTYASIFRTENKHIKFIDLSTLTSRKATNLIHKNEVFISNLNSLYASNKILAELDAL